VFLLWLSVLCAGLCSASAQGLDETRLRPDDSSAVERLLSRAGFNDIQKSYALVVGISEFEDFNDLPTAQDPLQVATYLVDEAGFDHVHILTGDKVTKDRLEELMLDDFRTLVGEKDRFLFYWSGHGETLGDGIGARGFLPLKSSRKGRYSTMVSMDDVADWDSYIQAHQVLYLMDSCFSGLVGVAPQSDLGEITRAQLSGPSRHVITAGRADEQTIAVDQLGGSVFTHALLKGLRGGADAANALGKDGLVTVGELKAYLGQEVTRLRTRFAWRKTITPQIRDLRGSDGAFFFPVPAAFPAEDAPQPVEIGPVLEVQLALRDLGYDPGSADGVLSFKTRAALIAFQRTEGLVETGKIDDPTLERIPFALAALVQPQGQMQGQVQGQVDNREVDQPPPEPVDEVASQPISPLVLNPCAACPELVPLPGGQIAFGPLPLEDASPENIQDIAPFFVARTEVTRGQFRAYAEATGLAFIDGKTSDGPTCFAWQPGSKLRRTALAYGQDLGLSDEHPVSCVSRLDAQLYIDWLNEENDGPQYRLPSEAEIEYLLEKQREYVIEEKGLSGVSEAEITCAIGNFGDARTPFPWRNTACRDGHASVAPVGSYEADQHGVSDIAGNLWEWVGECSTQSCGPNAWVKGGSFDDPVKNTLPDIRQTVPADRRQTNIGFRIARDIE
jgi:formylglycine-generating enzyme required for sulfatase activity